jgi:hypothetical protein
VTLTWIIGGAAVGVLAGPPVRAGVLARYAVAPPALAVEAAAGLALAVTAARAASPWQLAGLGWLMLCAVALAFIDAAIRRLPDPLTGAAFAGTLGLLAVAALTGGGHPGQLGRAVIAAAVLCGFYLALFIVRPSGMGLGDLLTELRRRCPQAADVTERGCFPQLEGRERCLGVPQFWSWMCSPVTVRSASMGVHRWGNLGCGMSGGWPCRRPGL